MRAMTLYYETPTVPAARSQGARRTLGPDIALSNADAGSGPSPQLPSAFPTVDQGEMTCKPKTS